MFRNAEAHDGPLQGGRATPLPFESCGWAGPIAYMPFRSAPITYRLPGRVTSNLDVLISEPTYLRRHEP